MRTHTLSIGMVVSAVFLGMGAAMAVEPAWEGQFGNPEEPAMRPYKNFIRGLLAIGHHTREAFVDGNLKTPIIGSVEAFRGLRIGAAECGERTYRGMAGAKPTPYKNTSETKEVIEEDIVVRNSADLAATGVSPGIFAAQKVVDHYPLDPDWRDKKIRAEQTQRLRAEAAAARQPEEPKTGVERAQERYLGKRANINPKAQTNLLKLAK